MHFEIVGDSLPSVVIDLHRGEGIYTQAGGMTWMTQDIKMRTNTQGGLFKGFMRRFTGESMFLASYMAQSDNQQISISSSFPGHILPIQLVDYSIIAQRTAFLAAQPSVNLSPYVIPGIGGGLFGGEGFILQKLSGQGLVFLEIDGDVMDIALGPNERIRVSTGHVAAFEETVRYSVERVGGVRNTLLGGEGMFHTTLTGPGRVWIQTIPLGKFAKKIRPHLGRSSRKRKKE